MQGVVIDQALQDQSQEVEVRIKKKIPKAGLKNVESFKVLPKVMHITYKWDVYMCQFLIISLISFHFLFFFLVNLIVGTEKDTMTVQIEAKTARNPKRLFFVSPVNGCSLH